MRKILIFILLLALLSGLAVPVSAAHVSGEEAIEALETLGLVKGTGRGFEPERGATRAEALVLLLRLLGRENSAKSGWTCPYTDGGWAASYIGYAAANALVKGVSETQFGSSDPVSAWDYLTMVLRALGYSEGEDSDFTWAQSIAFSDRIGLTHGEYSADSAFLREDMALISYTALTLRLKGSERTLAERLYQDGVLSAAALKATRLAGSVKTDEKRYTAAEIHQRGASAIVRMDMYESGEALRKNDSGSYGSGFFVTGDGVAAMSYHELDGYSYARATTLDGHVYDVTGVLYYDVARDIALVRVSRTDTKGVTVRFFPYLDIGDSDALCAGDTVYTLSNALGMIDNVSVGIVSNCLRTVDDPDYPCLQVTAPFSHGSSGGALLNEFGEAVGVLFGSFTEGQSMNLVIPINCIQGVRLTGSGTPLNKICETENVKKAKATITAARTQVTLHIGEEREILISHDCPGQTNLVYKIGDETVVSCRWGDFVSKQSVPIYLTGESAGETEVTISFVSGGGNENASAVIQVTVLEN